MDHRTIVSFFTCQLVWVNRYENIVSLDNCVTRLRLVVHDMKKLQDNVLKQAGALSVVKIDEHSVQVIIGAQVQTVKDNLDALL